MKGVESDVLQRFRLRPPERGGMIYLSDRMVYTAGFFFAQHYRKETLHGQNLPKAQTLVFHTAPA